MLHTNLVVRQPRPYRPCPSSNCRHMDKAEPRATGKESSRDRYPMSESPREEAGGFARVARGGLARYR